MPREPMNELDAELRRLLSVTPSPQFEATVRTRVSRERMAGSWWSRGWMLAATGAVAVVIAVASGAMMRDTSSSPAPVSQSPSVVAVSEPPAPLVQPASQPPIERRHPETSAPESRIARRHPPVRTVRAAPVAREPGVLVDARQTAGMNRLYEMVRAGTVLAVAESPSTADRPIVVEPLRVPALIIDTAPAGWPPGHPVQNEFQPTKE